MFERQEAQKNSKLGTSTTLKYHSENGLQDTILSLNHRLAAIQNSLNLKIDRAQCMLILQSKPSASYIKKILQEINLKVENDKKQVQERLLEQQKSSKKQIEKYKQKLKSKKKQIRKSANDKILSGLKSQQLYLQSNETMFSIIVDQINAIKQAQELYQKSIEQRNKITLSLNNEVCQKIQNLQRQIQVSLKLIRQGSKNQLFNDSIQSWSNSDQKSSRMKQTSKSNFQKTQVNINKAVANTNSGVLNNPETYQISHIMRTIETIQKQVSLKINIKDVLPIIKKNLQPITQMIDQVKNYTEQAIQSTKKILINQSQINQELCAVSKLGMWQSFESKDGLAVWNKEISNLVPQNFIYERDSTQIILAQQGAYIIKILTPSQYLPQCIIVGGSTIQFLGETIIKIEKNTCIQIPSSGEQIFVSIHKI